MARLTEAQVKKHNQKTTRFLVQKLRKLPPVIMARLTNATVRAVVNHTYQDSGRFNWNWNVQWNSKNPMGGSGTEYGVSPVGEKGEARGMGHSVVIKSLKDAIGFNRSNFSQGRLYENIRADEPTLVRIYNPLYSGKYGEYAMDGVSGVSTQKAKVNVSDKVGEAVAREATRIQRDIKFTGIR